MVPQSLPRERWLAHLERVLAVSEERKGRLEREDLAAIARELGITDDDLAQAHRQAEDHHVRGKGYFERGMVEEAFTEWHEAHVLAPERIDVALSLARAHLRRRQAGDHEAAQRLARMALEWEPGNQAAFAILADVSQERSSRTRYLAWIAGAAAVFGLVVLTSQLDEDADPPAPPPVVTTPTPPAPPPVAPEPETPAPEPAKPPTSAVPPSAVRADAECPRGTGFVPGEGCVATLVEITPGLGFEAARVGISTPTDVLAGGHRAVEGVLLYPAYPLEVDRLLEGEVTVEVGEGGGEPGGELGALDRLLGPPGAQARDQLLVEAEAAGEHTRRPGPGRPRAPDARAWAGRPAGGHRAVEGQLRYFSYARTKCVLSEMRL